ncbi:MAG: dihydrofolate reductase [Muribaculaceae bacterium]|nr:dihydrofolate reductase [Muribaculaceae bacterium]
MITLIAAVAADGGIGCRGNLLWHIPADLRHFKTLTMGAPVVMGRNTWESLPRRPLPGRRNIVVSRNAAYRPDGADIFTSLEAALQSASATAEAAGKDVFIIGGGALYADAMPLADVLELTRIDAVAEECDTWFPPVDPAQWRLADSEPHEESGLRYSFDRLERIPADSHIPGEAK